MSESIYRALRGLSRRELLSKNNSSNYFKSIPGRFYFICIIGVILSIVILLVWRVSHYEPAKVLSLLLLALSYFGIISTPFIELYFHRKVIGGFFKNPLATIYDNAKCNHEVDSKYISYFLSIDLDKLKIVHLELIAEKTAFEKRVALLVGAIEKVGVAPGVFAFLVSFDSIKKIELDWILAIAYVIPIFYLFGAFCHVLISRMERHISLIDYVVSEL